jgi:AcrR family transcriptional regulator
LRPTDRSPDSRRASHEGEPSSRARILDVAEALLALRGYAGVGLREVAAAVGLGRSSLFHHFPTLSSTLRRRAELYNDVLTRVVDRLEARLAPAGFVCEFRQS